MVMYLHSQMLLQDQGAVAAPAAVMQQPDSVRLRTGYKIPLLGYGTYKVQTADAVR